jgi:DNA-binding GntR family transcriptional regulator
LVDQVYEKVVERLYSRGLSGAENLSAGRLADAFGVSRTPVNMALVRLESEGLIRRSSGGGWEVVPLTLEDIEEIFDLKDVLDSLMVREAAENITPEMAEALRQVMDEMEMAAETGDIAGWVAADGHYHDLLSQIAGNDRLRRFQEALNHQFYRLWVGYCSMEGRMAVSCAEHRHVADAVCEGDADAAASAAYDHTRSLRKSLIDVVKNVLVPFLGQEL